MQWVQRSIDVTKRCIAVAKGMKTLPDEAHGKNDILSLLSFAAAILAIGVWRC